MVTTEPNELVAQIHDRLALILHPQDYDRWLGIDDKGGDPRPPLDLLHPYDAARMKMTPANPAVGNWQVEIWRCIRNSKKAIVQRPGSVVIAVPIVLGNCYRTFRPLTLVAVAGSLRSLRHVGWLK